jgi:hypothetical protein
MADKFKWQRQRWFNQHPYCAHCGCKLVLPRYTGRERSVPANAATIDHLRPRGHPERHEPNRFGLWRRVLACTACNNKKNVEFWRGRTLEEIWRMNGHWDRMALTSGALPSELA